MAYRIVIALTRTLGGAALLAWIYLLLFRARFWRMRDEPANGEAPPLRIAAIIPARDEAAVIGRAIESLAAQDYPGELGVVVVDDQSEDGTSGEAWKAIRRAGASSRFSVISGSKLAPGWTGKLWALSQGVDAALAWRPDYLLFTDADIVHAPDNLRSLVARAESGGLSLASYMVRLNCRSLAESALIPAFVFFFLKLYPPRWIADPRRRTAGAAGGCILLRPSALERIGGLASIRGEIIDDCALAKAVKSTGGRIWMGLSSKTVSVREYAGFGDIWNMIARTAFTQLRHSAVLLAGTIAGMAVLYMAPPALVFSGDRVSRLAGAAAWSVMAAAYIPALRLYHRRVIWAPALPLAAIFYVTATIGSAVRYWRGRGGQWKGRVQDQSGTS